MVAAAAVSVSVEALPKELGQSVRGARMRFLELLGSPATRALPLLPLARGRALGGRGPRAGDAPRAFAKLGEIHSPSRGLAPGCSAIATNAGSTATRRRDARRDSRGNGTPPGAGPTPRRSAKLSAPRPRPAAPGARAFCCQGSLRPQPRGDRGRARGRRVGAVKAALTGPAPSSTSEDRARAVGRERRAGRRPRGVRRRLQRARPRAARRPVPRGLEARVVGMLQEYGRDQIRAGSLHHTLFLEKGWTRRRARRFRGETVARPLVHGPRGRRDDARRRDVWRFEAGEGGLRSAGYYFFCPEVLGEIGRELGVPAPHERISLHAEVKVAPRPVAARATRRPRAQGLRGSGPRRSPWTLRTIPRRCPTPRTLRASPSSRARRSSRGCRCDPTARRRSDPSPRSARSRGASSGARRSRGSRAPSWYSASCSWRSGAPSPPGPAAPSPAALPGDQPLPPLSDEIPPEGPHGPASEPGRSVPGEP